jgi:glycosyltransferase involved in cell wall biosynthesis
MTSSDDSPATGRRLAFVITDAVSMNRLMRGQLEYLANLGTRMDLYCNGSPAELQMLAERQVGRVVRVPFRRPPHPFWDIVSLACLVWRLAGPRYDAVIYSTPKAMLLGSIAAFVTGQRRRIAWVRGRAYENMRGWKRRLYLGFDRLTFAISHKVLFISRSLQAEYRSDGLDKGSEGLVLGSGSSNGVDLERFRPATTEERTAARRSLGLDPKDFVIAVIGRVCPDKGSQEVLELADRLRDLPDMKIVFVGPLEDDDVGSRLRDADGARVLWVGPVGDTERIYWAADLHLFLSHREGLGNVALEAAASDVPTFAFDVVGVRDAVVPDQTGLLFPFGELGAIELAIREAAADRRGFAARFRHARAWVAEHFDQSQVWSRYAEVFLDEAPVRPA